MEVFFFNFIGHLAGAMDPGGVFPDLNPGPDPSFKKKPNRIEKQPGPGRSRSVLISIRADPGGVETGSDLHPTLKKKSGFDRKEKK